MPTELKQRISLKSSCHNYQAALDVDPMFELRHGCKSRWVSGPMSDLLIVLAAVLGLGWLLL